MLRFPWLLCPLVACIPVAVEGPAPDSDTASDSSPDIDSAIDSAIDSVDDTQEPDTFVDSVDTTDSTDTADTADDPHDGTLAALEATCVFEDDADLGWVIHCASTWSEADAAALDGGTLYLNLLDESLASVYTDVLEISWAGLAFLDGTTVQFWVGGVDGTSEYTVYYWVETWDGSASSDEVGYVVEPL